MANYDSFYQCLISNRCNFGWWYALVSVTLLVLSQFRTSIGEPLKIRPKLCNNALGEEGTCMFVWECIKTEGRHLGTCVDGFLFGSCCGHNESSNSINSLHDYSSQPPDSMATSATVVNPHPVTTSTTLKEKHKNKWRPTTAATTTVTPVTEQTPVYSSPISVSAINKNTTRPINTSIPIVPYKPATTPKPWFIYTVKRPVFSSTHRPAYIAVVPTSRPPVHFHQPTNFPNRNPLPNPTTASPIHLSSNLIVSQSTKYPPIPSSATESSIVSSNSSVTVEPMTNGMGSLELSTTTASSATPPQSAQHSPGQITDINRPLNNKDQCGVTQLRPKTKVVGGKNSAFGAWPWQVSVRRTSFFGFSSTHRCGGAILNSEWIATAGHCVDDLLLTQIRIRLGEYDFSSALEPLPHIERGAKKKVVHPKYNFFTYENDLALVQLDQPIEFLPHVASICLPPDNIDLLGRNATVTGWGRLSEGGVLPTVLQEVRVPIVSNDKCKNMFLSAGRHEYIPDIFMCAGFDEGGHDSCQGDSGGPLQVQGDDGRWFLAGIISWGIGCGEPSLPGVCTRITKFKQWILSYISN